MLGIKVIDFEGEEFGERAAAGEEEPEDGVIPGRKLRGLGCLKKAQGLRAGQGGRRSPRVLLSGQALWIAGDLPGAEEVTKELAERREAPPVARGTVPSDNADVSEKACDCLGGHLTGSSDPRGVCLEIAGEQVEIVGVVAESVVAFLLDPAEVEQKLSDPWGERPVGGDRKDRVVR